MRRIGMTIKDKQRDDRLDQLDLEITLLYTIVRERLLELEAATKKFVDERLAVLEKKIDG
jgi:hypothetical protein